MVLLSGQWVTRHLELTRVTKIWVNTAVLACLGLTIAMVVAVTVSRAFNACDWNLGQWLHCANPDIPCTTICINELEGIGLSFRRSQQPRTLILLLPFFIWSCDNIFMPEDPWPNFWAVNNFSTQCRVECGTIILVLLSVFWMASMISILCIICFGSNCKKNVQFEQHAYLKQCTCLCISHWSMYRLTNVPQLCHHRISQAHSPKFLHWTKHSSFCNDTFHHFASLIWLPIKI